MKRTHILTRVAGFQQLIAMYFCSTCVQRCTRARARVLILPCKLIYTTTCARRFTSSLFPPPPPPHTHTHTESLSRSLSGTLLICHCLQCNQNCHQFIGKHTLMSFITDLEYFLFPGTVTIPKVAFLFWTLTLVAENCSCPRRQAHMTRKKGDYVHYRCCLFLEYRVFVEGWLLCSCGRKP